MWDIVRQSSYHYVKNVTSWLITRKLPIRCRCIYAFHSSVNLPIFLFFISLCASVSHSMFEHIKFHSFSSWHITISKYVDYTYEMTFLNSYIFMRNQKYFRHVLIFLITSFFIKNMFIHLKKIWCRRKEKLRE